MTSRCERGLGWPADEPSPPPEGYLNQDELLRDLEEMREFAYGSNWKPAKASFTLAMLVVKGLRRRKR